MKSKKKILILNGQNTLNYGSFMMLQNFIIYTHKLNPDVNFIVDLKTENDLERLRFELDDIGFKRVKITKKHAGNSIITKILNFFQKVLIRPFKIMLINPSKVVILGGDDLGEYYTKVGVIFDLLVLKLLSSIYGLYLFGQTIGPFTSFRKSLARVCLSRAYIISRDSSSYNHLLDELKLKRISLSSDLAFMDLPKQDGSYVTESKNIILVPSGLVDQYTTDFDKYVQFWVRLIEKLLEKFPNDITLLGHVLGPADVDDRIVIEVLSKHFQGNNRIQVIIDQLSSWEARKVLGNGYFTLTGRMHAAISTFQMGKPAISLAYSLKYDGIISQDMDLPKLVIDARGNEKWKSIDKLLEETIQRVDLLTSDYDGYTKKIKKKVEAFKGNVADAIDKIL